MTSIPSWSLAKLPEESRIELPRSTQVKNRSEISIQTRAAPHKQPYPLDKAFSNPYIPFRFPVAPTGNLTRIASRSGCFEYAV